jgi:hypothetical protein
MEMRQKGRVKKGVELIVIGHPLGLPRKYSGGAIVTKSRFNVFFSNLDTYGGNSGSAVINLETLEVEGILIAGQPDWQYDHILGCYYSNQCPDTGCPGFEKVMRIRPVMRKVSRIQRRQDRK